MCYMSLLSFFILRLTQFGPVRDLKAGFCVFLMFPSFFEHVFTLWPNKIIQVHLVLFLLQLWNQPFLQGALVPSSVTAPGVSLLPGMQWTEQRNI